MPSKPNLQTERLNRDEPGDWDERVIRENRWVERLNGGDNKAFEEIYRFYYPKLAQFLFRYLHSENTIEDVLHNLFYTLWKNRTNIKPIGTLRAYLYNAARNQALKQLSKNQKLSVSSLTDYPNLSASQIYPEEKVEYKEFAQAFLDAVQCLPEKRRQIFLLHREDSLTYREIAEVLDISIKTVETQMSRSIKFLSEKLAHHRE